MNKNIIVKTTFSAALPNKIFYGLMETPKYGQLFVAYFLEKNPYICYVHFTGNQTMGNFTNDLQKLWPNLEYVHDDKLTNEVFENCMTEQKEKQEVYVVLNGTDFQKKVWSALLEIPFGEERTYGELAVAIGNPKAVRAVGSAVGSNNIAIFIPCHRVKAKTGDSNKYRWGGDLKNNILLDERQRK